jgi:hypothetical protein
MTSDRHVTATFTAALASTAGGTGETVAPPPPSSPVAKRLKCKTGFRKVKRHGRTVCRKIHRHRHRG